MSVEVGKEGPRGVKVLMVGPLPPPMGGVSNFVQSMRNHFRDDTRYEVEVYRTGQMGHRPAPVVQVASDLKKTLRFFLEFKRYDAAIVHVHTSSYYSFQRNIFYVLWARHFSDAHMVVHVHGGMFMQFYEGASPFGKKLVRTTLKRADAIIVTSPSWIGKLKGITGPNQITFSLPNGFDPLTFRLEDRTRARDKLGIGTTGKVMVTVGVLEDVKGHRYLVEAMRAVRERVDDIRLYIIGRGSKKEQLEEQVRDLGLGEVVKIIDEPLPLTLYPSGSPPPMCSCSPA